jgi:type I restriction enzyme S subunit
MISALKPYPEYKDSGISWLGKIPSSWRVRRMKLLLDEVDSRSSTGKEQLLRVSQYSGVTQRRASDGSDAQDSRASSLVGYKRVIIDDLVINIMLAWNGSMGVSRYDGIVSPAYCVYRFKADSRPWYYHELLRLPIYKGRIRAASTGIVESRLRLYSDKFGCIEAIQPPSEEQGAIVKFLDHTNQRIDQFIRAKKKVIALLNEQKQAIVHRAITRGLDPNAPLKASGIPWLGDIPRHYMRTRLGHVCLSIRDGTHNPPPAVPGIHRCLSVRNIVNGRFVTRTDDRTMTPAAFVELQRSYTVEVGDIVIALVGATTGKSAVVEEMKNTTVQRSLGILRPDVTIIKSSFLNLLITSDVIQGQIRQIMDKYAAQPGIYLTELGRLQVIYPSVEEQQAIVAQVDAANAPFNEVRSRTEREIELIREYRTRLIADVITGKLDVREAVRSLPAETEELTLDSAEEESLEETEIIEEEQIV